MSEVQELLQKRITRIVTAMNNTKEPDMVPIMPLVETWTAYNYDRNLLDITFDLDGLYDTFTRFARDFDIDAFAPPLGCRWGPLYSALGSSEFSFYNEDGKPHPGVQHLPRSNMSIDEYPELIADPLKFMIDKYMPRRWTALTQPEPRRSLVLAKAALQYSQYFSMGIGRIASTCITEIGVPAYLGSSTFMPLDLMCDFFRGFEEVCLDVRRHRKELIAACDAIYPLMLTTAIAGQEPCDIPAVFIPLHIPTFLRPKDFKEVYFPTFKRMIEDIVAAGKRPHLFMEGDWTPYFEFFDELPKNKIVGMFEFGNYKQFKDTYGSMMCLMGGMPVDLLNYGTKEEIIKHVREVIEIMAPGGGWIFGFDKAALSPNDCNPDNLRTAIETVRKYGVYK